MQKIDAARLPHTLQDQETRLRAVLDTVIDSIVTIDERGIIQTTNPATTRLFGYAAAEMAGRNVKMLMPDPYAREHDGYLANYLKSGRARIIGIGREVVGRRKDGSTFPMELSVSEMWLGEQRHFVGVVRDIEGRRKAEDAYRRTKDRLSYFLENSPGVIYAHDPAGEQVVTFVSDNLTQVLGYRPEDCLGKADFWSRNLHPDDALRVQADRKRLHETGELTQEYRFRHADGDYLWLHDQLRLVRDLADEPAEIVGLWTDISDKKAAEADLARSHRLLAAISRAQARFIGETEVGEVFDQLLADLLDLTDSEYGFIGDVLQAHGRPYLKIHAIANVAWDEATRDFFDRHAPQGMEFSKLDTLIGAVLSSGRTVIANDPAHDPRRGGLPKGHPPLDAFLGQPFHFGERMVGMLGIANRPGGYDEEIVQFLEPLLRTCAQLIEALRQNIERKLAQQALQETTSLQRAILDGANFSIIATDPDGTIRMFNRGAEAMLGYPAEEVVGNLTSAILHDPDEVAAYAAALSIELETPVEPGFETLVAKARLGQVDEGEWIHIRKDGSRLPVLLSVTALRDPEGAITGFLGIAGDITERKKVERMKSEFVSTVSHELRTPLTSIRGALGLVLGKLGGQLPDRARQMLETANRNSERLTVLINDILDLEKIKSERLEFEFRPLDLAALTHQALAANEGYAQAHEVRFRLVEAPERADVRGDELRLLQVFANLLSNAAKYSPPGSEVEVALEDRDGHFRVSVRDHGAGIPDEFRSRIFQRFAQADGSDTREKGGTGLGLSIAKAIVERHNGLIGYATEAGEGTEFFFDLPEWQEVDRQPDLEDGRPRLLICEDNPVVAAVLSELLAAEGLASDIAATAEAARELLAQKTYQALLLDLSLPDTDGLALIQELRGQETTRQLPIVVVSGRAEEGRRAWTGDALAVADWLQKPVDQARLAQAVRQALRQGGRPRILHVEDDPDIIQVTQALVEEVGEYAYATSLAQARRQLAGQTYDLVLLDLALPDGSGLDLIDELKGRVPVVIFSGQEPGNDLTRQVTAALTKSRTSNERLLETIRQAIRR